VCCVCLTVFVLCGMQKCLEKALPLYEELVDIQRKTLGVSHPSVAAAMVNLGILYCQRVTDAHGSYCES
jgi:hypothetical protein